MLLRIALLSTLCLVVACKAEVEIITEPRSGEEYVFVSGGQPHPVRQPKEEGRQLEFETSHKIPEKLPSHHVSRDTEEKTDKFSKIKTKPEYSPLIDALKSGQTFSKSHVKRESGEGIIEIEVDKKAIKKDLKKKASSLPLKPTEIEIDLPLSKIENIKISETSSDSEVNAQMDVELEPMSLSGKLVEKLDVTTQRPVLTTGAPSTPRSFEVLPVNLGSADSINSGLLAVSADSGIPLDVAGSEQKQHSKIAIKKGPNGQEYEYEYVYYYSDDDSEDPKLEKTDDISSEEATQVLNSHDGPQNNAAANQITSSNSRSKNRYNSIERTSSTTTTSTTATPENNEVLPGSSRSRYRGRNLAPTNNSENDTVDERSRSNTTPSAHDKRDDESSEKASRHRSKSSDNHAEETTGANKSRSRANVRRPSLELVDSASFNTHSSDVSVAQNKGVRSKINSVEDREAEKLQKSTVSSDATHSRVKADQSSEENYEEKKEKSAEEEAVTVSQERETTEYTTMAAMDKVALELYAILAGENLKNEITTVEEDEEASTEEEDAMSTTEVASTTEEPTTTTTTTEPPTTTTTTAAPSPAPSAPTRANRFKGRGAAKPRPAATSTEAPTSAASKGKGRYSNSRPSFGRNKASSSTSGPEIKEEKLTKTDAAPVQSLAKPSLSRNRFSGRSRPTTSTTASSADEISSTTESVGSRIRRPGLKPRSRRPLPGASTSTSPSADPVPSESSPDSASSIDSSSTTARSLLGRRAGGNVRPLRPNPRLALGGRLGSSTTSSTTEASSAQPDSSPDVSSSAEQSDATTQQPGDATVANPLSRLRGRPRLQVAAARPKVAAPPAPRRPSPLLARRQQLHPESAEVSSSTEGQSITEPSEDAGATEKVSSGSAEDSQEVVPSEEPATEAPRGLSSLLAGRRRINRKPGTIL